MYYSLEGKKDITSFTHKLFPNSRRFIHEPLDAELWAASYIYPGCYRDGSVPGQQARSCSAQWVARWECHKSGVLESSVRANMISSNWGLFPFRYRLNWDKLQIPKTPGDSLEFLISNLIFLVAGRVFYKLFSHYYSNPTFKLRNKESILWILRVYSGDWKYLWYVFTIFFWTTSSQKAFI